MRRSFVLLLPVLAALGCGLPSSDVGQARAAQSGDIACDQFGCISLSKFAAAIKSSLDGKVLGYAAKVGAQPAVTGGLARSAIDSPPSGVAMSTSRNIQIASLSKLMTTVAVLQVIHQKDISLDEKISKFLWPGWTLGPNVNKITVRELLTHTSGIQTGSGGDPCGGATTDFATLKSVIAGGVKSYNLGFASYSNCNFALFREMLPFMLGYSYSDGDDDKLRAGWSMLIYEAYVRQYVFAPLGFADVFCTGAQSDVLAYSDASGSSQGYDFPEFNPGTCGGGGWYLSLDDLALFASDLASGTKMLTTSEKAVMNDYSLGWDNSVGNCTSPSLCKNGQMISGSNQQVNTYLGIVKCNQPVVAVANSPLPAPYNANGAITQLIAAAMTSAALPQSEAPATCCDGNAPCGGPGGTCCAAGTYCSASGTCARACRGLGYSCSIGDDCCSGTCNGSVCSCVPAGHGCSDGATCCNGYVCSAGVCKMPSVDTCNGRPKPTGGCSSFWSCCGTDGWECGRCK